MFIYIYIYISATALVVEGVSCGQGVSFSFPSGFPRESLPWGDSLERASLESPSLGETPWREFLSGETPWRNSFKAGPPRYPNYSELPA